MASPERKAQARIENPVDIGQLIQRTARMASGTLDLLEQEYVEFQAAKKGVPKKFVQDLEGVSSMLNELTLAHSRYVKAENEWAAAMSDAEKLESMETWLLALHANQPDPVRRWVSQVALKLNHATSAALGVVREVARRPKDQEVWEANDPGNDAWPPVT